MSGRDDLIFQDANISVTTTLVKVGSRSYPINGIGSVDVVPPKRGKALTLAVVAGFIAWSLLNEPTKSDTDSSGRVAAVVCVLAAIYALSKPHALVFRTASGDQQALTQRNRSYLLEVQAAVEKAVTARG